MIPFGWGGSMEHLDIKSTNYTLSLLTANSGLTPQ